jgi:4-diphosphocytidyl-2-C-methyl-D-erythritol kinase
MNKREMKGFTDQILVVVSAKVNLFLKILETCDSGYHLIETLFHSIDFRDEVVVKRAPGGIRLTIDPADHPGVPDGPENIVYKAAERFFRACEMDPEVEITLRKRIPVGGGLGGGSADAAAALRGLNLLYGSPISEARISHMGGDLGSDVPFLMYGGCAIAWGRGDRMIPLSPLAALHVGICYPRFPVSSGWAYGQLDEQGGVEYPGTSLMMIDNLNRSDWVLSHLENDFEDVIFNAHPQLKAIKETMRKMGAVGSLLSGSGSSVFGIFRERKDMLAALKEVDENFSADVYESSFLSQGMVIEIPMEG